MMLIVGGSFDVAPEQREAFLAERLEVMRRSRAEAGCLEYTFAADPLEPGRVILFERWESQAALDAHLAVLRSTPQQAGGQVRPASSEVVVYEVGGARTVS